LDTATVFGITAIVPNTKIGYQVSGIRYQVSGIRGIRYQVSGIRYQESGRDGGGRIRGGAGEGDGKLHDAIRTRGPGL
jgi:hypothetical protein